MLRLAGYSDRLSAAPGQTVSFMVSCDVPRYETRLVRLIHGDTNPAGPGFRQVVVPSQIDGDRPGRHQDLRPGSYARIPLPDQPCPGGFTFSVFVQPWNPSDGEQVIASRGLPYDSAGWALALDATGGIELVVGTGTGTPSRHTVMATVARWQWYQFIVSVSAEHARVTVWHRPVDRMPITEPFEASAFEARGLETGVQAPLILAALEGPLGVMTRHFDGKIDRPRLVARAMEIDEASELGVDAEYIEEVDGLIGAWDLGADLSSDRVVDHSSLGHDGCVINMPTRAVTGHNHSGRETCFRLAPDEYGAIHFHRDDLEDAGWDLDFSFEIPADLPTGVYAAWLTADGEEDYIPFVVRPPQGRPGSKIAVLMSTLTYLSYENFTDLGKMTWRDPDPPLSPLNPFCDPTVSTDVYRFIDENLLYGPYDRHVDGSGTCYGSLLRPILTMRPKFRYRILSAPTRFAADLYLVDWLEHEQIAVDYITDHDLHETGVDLLSQYNVVVSSAHHEYWTEAMLDGLEAYLDGGGRFMYLGGNSLLAAVSIDPQRPHKIECRRWGAGWPYEVPPAERYHSTTGEPGGLWRNRARPPHRVVGIGSAGAGFDRGSPFKRTDGALDPRVQFVFDGLAPDELIGDCPSLQLRWGAAGYEFDRRELELGSPARTLVLASSNRFNQSHYTMIEDWLWFADGRDGHTVDEPHVPGRPHRFARADISYLEYPRGGAVFSAGSIAWRSCLSAYDYANSVSRVTANVLHRFAETPKGTSPSDPAP
jgi:N,N-dimethylformamidase